MVKNILVSSAVGDPGSNPEGGEGGGDVVAIGTPEEIAKNSQSYTGQYLSVQLQKP